MLGNQTFMRCYSFEETIDLRLMLSFAVGGKFETRVAEVKSSTKITWINVDRVNSKRTCMQEGA